MKLKTLTNQVNDLFMLFYFVFCDNRAYLAGVKKYN